MSILWTDVKTFFINQVEVTKIQLNGTTLWEKSSGPTPGPDYTEPFYIENLDSGSNTIRFKKNNNNAPTVTIFYSTDKTNWTRLGNTSYDGLDIAIDGNSKMYFRCNTLYWGQQWNGTTTFYYNTIISNSSKYFKVGGNIMSLLYGGNFTGNETTFPESNVGIFYGLFNNSSYLTDISDLLLPATTLKNYCYAYMFYRCTSLTTPPELPATALAESCYQYMFSGCTSLATAPELPASTLAPYCYAKMFNGCTSLTTPPELPATALAPYCYNSMFDGCTGLTTAPVLPATTLAPYCYYGMFVRCTSLSTPPELPATTLAERCYANMFVRCTFITAPELPATTLAPYCYDDMFWNCISLTTIPELPATRLVEGCYRWMFENCTSLNYVKCLATNISATNCTKGWFSGVTSTGTFVKDANMSSWTTGVDGIPSGWTVQDAS